MYQPSLEQARALAGAYSAVPVSREIYADIKTPIAVLKTLQSVSTRCYLLESVEGGEKWSRYSFLGFDPVVSFRCKDGLVTIQDGAAVPLAADGPNAYIRRILQAYRSPRFPYLPPFAGGFVGYFAYDYCKYNDRKINLTAVDDLQLDDIDLMLFDKVIAFDHLKQKIVLIVNIKTDDLEENYKRALPELDRLVALIKGPAPAAPEPGTLHTPFRPVFTEAQYAAKVDQVKRFIKEGDIFQAVPANRQEARFTGSLFNTYRALRTINPSPYMVYLKSDDVEIAAASPETLIKLQDGQLATYPIAGTKPRGATEEEDLALEEALRSDAKELAEHNMLVDLSRNDLGRIGAFGSVQVKEYLEVQRYSHVMHLTSTITATLRPGLDALDALAAMLPAGTLSGAPKLRAIEIIDEIEGTRRGVYGGAIGYIDFTGNMDACIAIRMAVKKDDRLFVAAGGGVVADSDPYKEYQETRQKARAVIQAVTLAQEVLD